MVDCCQAAKDIASPQSHSCVKSALTFVRLVLAAAFLAIAAAAQQHPTMLDPNVRATACIGCHENQAKNKNAHSATEKNCLSCHEVRVNKDVTRVKLLTATPTKLCLQCHSKQEGGVAGTHVHDQGNS